MPACPASSGGSGGTASANSINISRTSSRGAEANSSTISASFGGISVTQRPYAARSGRRRGRHEGQVTQADDADHLAVGVTDQQPPYASVAHGLQRLVGRGRLLDHDQLMGGDHAEGGCSGREVLGDR